MAVRMELSKIIISEVSEQQMIVLKEVDGIRSFPILIGLWEAMAIDRNIKDKKPPRPLTHELIVNIIRGLNVTLDHVVVNDLNDSTFYAKLALRKNGTVVEIDSRPSDAIAVAVQMRAPIFVEERVLDSVVPKPGANEEA